MRITGYRTLTTAQEWGRPVGDANGVYDDGVMPVPIIMVGLGDEVDMDALRAISAATGGKAYQAPNPEDIRGVLLDAVSQRRCRPNC